MNTAQSDGKTPLHLAACSGHPGCVRHLADRSAGLRALDGEGKTPFDLAHERKMAEASTLLKKLMERIR